PTRRSSDLVNRSRSPTLFTHRRSVSFSSIPLVLLDALSNQPISGTTLVTLDLTRIGGRARLAFCLRSSLVLIVYRFALLAFHSSTNTPFLLPTTTLKPIL